jgi:hypothetical protein
MTTMSQAGTLSLVGLAERQILFFHPGNIALFVQKSFQNRMVITNFTISWKLYAISIIRPENGSETSLAGY